MGFFGFGKSKIAETVLKVGYDGKEAERGLNKLTKTIGAVISVYALKQLTMYTLELAKVGATADLVNRSFEKLAKDNNRNAIEMMGSLRKATKGMVDDMQLQQKAMQAIISGVDFDSVVTAMEFVTNFALTTGTDVNMKMQSVMTGLARKSAAFLDDVGIQVMGSKDVVGDAIKQMKEKMGIFIASEDDAIVKSKQLTASIKNLRAEIGVQLIPVLVKTTDLMTTLMEGANFMFRGEGITPISKKAEEMAKQGEELILIKQKLAFLDKHQIDQAKVLLQTHRETGDVTIKLNKGNKIRNAWDTLWISNSHTVNKGELDRNKLLDQRFQLFNKMNKTMQTQQFLLKKGTPATPALSDVEEIDIEEQMIKREANEMIRAMDHNKNITDMEKAHKKELLDIQTIYDMANLSQEEMAHKDRVAGINAKYAEYEQLFSSNEEVMANIKKAKDKDIEALEDEHNATMLIKETEQQQQRIALQRRTVLSLSTLMGSFQSFQQTLLNKRLDALDEESMSDRKREREKEKLIEDSKAKQKVMARFEQGIAIAQAIIDTQRAAAGSLAGTPGGIIPRTLAAALAIAQGAMIVAKIQAQHFELGGTVGKGPQRYRSRDSVPAMLGAGERVISAPQAAMHSDVLDSIANNTLNTSASVKRLNSGGSTVYNIYSITDEQLARVTSENKRRSYVGEQI
jgi:hypothetical protein